MIVVLVPTFGRPDRIAGVNLNVAQVASVPTRCLFVLEPTDTASIDAAKACGAEFLLNQRAASYCGACNTGYKNTLEPYLFTGADDIVFHPGWDTACLAMMSGRIQVVGTNDLLNPHVLAGHHATHYLVDRRYLDEFGGVVDEGPGSFEPECYAHAWSDTEFIATAKMRCRFAPCLDAVVEHRHAQLTGVFDATYEKTNSQTAQDEALYESRKPLWQNISR